MGAGGQGWPSSQGGCRGLCVRESMFCLAAAPTASRGPQNRGVAGLSTVQTPAGAPHIFFRGQGAEKEQSSPSVLAQETTDS